MLRLHESYRAHPLLFSQILTTDNLTRMATGAMGDHKLKSRPLYPTFFRRRTTAREQRGNKYMEYFF